MANTVPPARRRKLQIYAADPMSGRRHSFRVIADIPNEPGLRPGPAGSLVEVVDYDGAHDCYYDHINLNDPALLMTEGLPPNDGDPRFHQQMVYAVASKVIENARRALGRPISFRRSEKNPRLRLMPHAFYGANAFFSPKQNAILFGYFRAAENDVDGNIPGQTVFTCLSHDIIAHEVTHAIIHRLRPYFLEPTNPDVLAFHEAFADLVALFQRYTYRDLLKAHIRTSGARLRTVKFLTDLAAQFGHASGMRKALRSAMASEPDPSILARTIEPHARGAILMAAVFDGFFQTYDARVGDLLRLAGIQRERAMELLDPDLVERIASEVSTLADYLLRMCFRAFDYMPPIDPTFGDFLRALVTADYEVNPRDSNDLRFNIIEAFRLRGIYADVSSLAEEALILHLPDGIVLPSLPSTLTPLLAQLFIINANALDEAARASDVESTISFESFEKVVGEGFVDLENDTDDSVGADTDYSAASEHRDLKKKIGQELFKYGWQHAIKLGMLPSQGKIAVKGFSPVYRIGVDQRLMVELVVQYVQTDRDETKEIGGLPPRAGATVVFDLVGRVRHVIAKPRPGAGLKQPYRDMATLRAKRANAYIGELDASDPRMAWPTPDYEKNRMKLRMDLRALHGGGC